jgi:hypothetical protein
MGGDSMLVIIDIIWFKLVIFDIGSNVGKNKIKYEVKVKMDIGKYKKIYEM